MKWFQHHADAHDDEIIRELLHKFGTDGIAVWWTTAELVCRALKVSPDPKNPHGYRATCRLEADPRVFADALANKVPIDRFESILKHCARRRRFSFKVTKHFWVVSWSKLLDFKDNATRDIISAAAKLLASPLASDLEATGAGVDLLPSLKGQHPDRDVDKGDGGEGGGPPGEGDLVWERRVILGWNKVFSAPGGRSKRDHIRDWVRQGVPRRDIEEAPMRPEYQHMDFFEVGKELKRRANGNGHRKRGHGDKDINPGAKEVLRTFAVQPGEFDDLVKRKIADRERGDAEAARAQEDRGGAGGAPAGDPGRGA